MRGMNANGIECQVRAFDRELRKAAGAETGIRTGFTYEFVGGPLCGQSIDLPDKMVYLSLSPYGWGKPGHTIGYCLRDDGIARYREIKLDMEND